MASSPSSGPPSPNTIKTFSSSIATTATLHGDHVAPQLTTPSTPAATTPAKPQLSFSGIARLFLSVRRARQRAKADNIVSSSGDAPATSAALQGADAPVARKVAVTTRAAFLCAGGVDAPKLIRVTRETLLARALQIGANALVDERWVCTISSKSKGENTYRTYVDYDALAARSDIPDAHRPVALEKAQGVPGLMTVLDRA